MFEVGEFVKIKKNVIDLGKKYKFKITEVKEAFNPACINVYKIERDKQCSLDPVYGPYDYQLKKIYEIENTIWDEDELEPINSFPKGYEFKEVYVEEPFYPEGPAPDKPQEIKVSGKNLFDGGELMYNYYKNIKEDKTMKILDIYRERKEFEINQNYIKNRNEIIKEDEIQKIIREMELQINTILDIEERLDRVDFSSRNEELLTNVSKEKLEKLEAETDKERDKLHDNIEEIKALFELTEDYEERMKILKKYDIINKDGKLSI